MKKIISMFLVSLLTICMFSIPAMAADSSIEEKNIQTFTMNGSDASATIKNKIEETGVSVTNESKIQLVPISSTRGENSNSALVITNESDNIVTKDILLLVTDEGVGFERGSDVSTRAGSTVEYPPLSWDGRYVIRGTAVYNKYVDSMFSSYYQPIGAYFSYQKYETCTVNNITMKYICDGFEYSYPDFRDLNLPELEYVITVTKSSPAPSTMYSTTREYNTGRAIRTSSGSPFV